MVTGLSAEREESAEESGDYRRSNACKPRGGPKISRRRIASRKLDSDPSNLSIFILKSARLAIPKAFGAAEASTAVSIIDGC